MAEIDEYIRCPMIKKNIDVGYCIELQMVANNEVKPTKDEEYLTAHDWNICKNCVKQNCPSPDVD